MSEDNLSARKLSYQEINKTVDNFLKSNDRDELKILLESCRSVKGLEYSRTLYIINKGRFTDEVKKLLTVRNKQIVRYVTRLGWFFKETCNDFFLKLLPVVSLSTRLKIVGACAKFLSDDRIPEVFDFVFDQFGLRQAELLVHRLSKERLRVFIHAGYGQLITDRTFIRIAKRYPESAIAIAKKKKNDWCFPRKTRIYLLTQDLEATIALDSSQKYRLIGRKLIRSLVTKRLTNLESSHLPNLKKCTKRWKSVLRRLTHDQMVEYMCLFLKGSNGRICLKDWEQGLSHFREDLKVFSRERREQLLTEAFKKVFSVDLWETPEAWSPPLLELVTEKCRSAALQQNQKGGDDTWLYLKPPRVAFPAIITAIKRSPDRNTRLNYLTEMVRCCLIHKELTELEAVCVHVSNHHRNEDDGFLDDFLYGIKPFLSAKSSLTTLTAIQQIISTYTPGAQKLHLLHAQVLEQQNEDNSRPLEQFIEYGTYNIKLIPEILLPKLIKLWKDRARNKKGMDAIKALKQLLDGDVSEIKELIEHVLAKVDDTDFRYIYDNSIFDSFLRHPEGKPFLPVLMKRMFSTDYFDYVWWMKHQPNSFWSDVDFAFNAIIKDRNVILALRSNPPNAECKKRLKEVCLNQWKEKPQNHKEILKLLALFCDVEEFYTLSVKFLTEGNDDNSLMEVVCNSLKYTFGDPWDIRHLMATSVRAITILTLCVDRITPLEVIDFWRHCEHDQQQRAIKLLASATTKPYMFDELLRLKGDLSHPAAICSAVKVANKIFLENPSLHNFEMFKFYFNCGLFRYLRLVMTVSPMAGPHLSEYAECVWRKIVESRKGDKDMIRAAKRATGAFYKSITAEIVPLLSLSLVKVLIDFYSSEGRSFSFQALQRSDSYQLKDCLRRKFAKNSENSEKFLKLVFQEVSSNVCGYVLNVLSECFDVLDGIGLKLRVLQIQIFKLWFSSKPENFAVAVINSLRSFTNLPLMFPELAFAVSEVMSHLSSKLPKFDIFWLVKEMLPFCETRMDYVFICNLLPQTVPIGGPCILDDRVGAYNQIIKVLGESNDKFINIYVNAHLRSV